MQLAFLGCRFGAEFSGVPGKLVAIFGKNLHIEAVAKNFWSNRGLYMQVISFVRRG